MDGRESGNQHASHGSGEISASNGTLCEKCLAVSWKPDDVGHRQRVEGLYEWELDHHETFSDLEASCEAGCPLCQTLFLLLVYDGLGSETSGPLLWVLGCNRDRWYLELKPQSPDINEWLHVYDAGIYTASQAATTVKGIISDNPMNTDANGVPQALHRPVWQMICVLSAMRALSHGLKPVYALGHI